MEYPSHITLSLVTIFSPASAQLSVSFYGSTCPSVFDSVRAAVRSAINRETRMGASIIRLFFHDCFVNGCDGSVLLDDTGSFVGEQTAFPNRGIRGVDAVANIKTQVDRACGRSVVSCADILAIAARDSVVELGGPSYSVPLGRRDARTASIDTANSDLPAPNENLDSIIQKFGRKGFSEREMVALSGTHTVGQARCVNFRDRIYNETNIDPAFATSLQANCPRARGSGDDNLAPLDPQSPNRFGNNYFQALINRRGLLHSDQVLFNGGSTDSIVTSYSNNAGAFSTDLANAMAKMGNLNPLTGTQGEIRANCRRFN
ncbi:peroxidase P7-like isoform X2 [Aristolochia californica]|uniref:peroxidase P7-like isoform X2 n=1 Tax=Aristolochia californica TaxID=171875 RepID=UPI0035E381D3